MDANEVLGRFEFAKLLNADQGGRRIILHGTISGQPALLLAERGAFSVDDSYLASFSQSLSNVQNLGDNDIYRWYLANTGSAAADAASPPPADLKINLIYPCTDKHIRKYSFQQSRVVTETPEIYAQYVRPYMQRCREEGRLNWVFNILEGRTEQENVLYRSSSSSSSSWAPSSAAAAAESAAAAAAAAAPPPTTDDDFLLLPDLNWDRQTERSLHLLALVARRDVWSVRDLSAAHAPWLRHLRATLARTVAALYPAVAPDMLKFYVHYQPTYYHFHIHVVHVDLDATATQAVGKALGLDHVISQLENLAASSSSSSNGSGGEATTAPGMHQVELTYTLGEESELWTQVFLPLKEGRKPAVGK